MATIHNVAKAVVIAPNVTTVHGVLAVDHVINLQCLVMLAFGSLSGKVVASGIQSVTYSKVIGQWSCFDHGLQARIQTQFLRIGSDHIVSADVQSGNGVSTGIN